MTKFVKLLLSKRYKRDLEVNAINSEGLTAADLIGLQTREGENPDQIFRHAGALKAQEIPSDKRSFKHVIFKVVNHLTTILSEEYLYYFRYRRDRDSPSEVRNVLLVVLGLIVSATYQTGVSPPSLHLPPGFIPFINSTSINTIHGERLCRLFRRSNNDDGLDIYVYPHFNSLAFFFSLAMMVVLTTGFPMQIELMIALMLLVFNFLNSSAVFQGPGYFLNPFSWFFLLWFIWKAVQLLLELGLLGRSRKSAAAVDPVSHIRDADSVETPLVGQMHA